MTQLETRIKECKQRVTAIEVADMLAEVAELTERPIDGLTAGALDALPTPVARPPLSAESSPLPVQGSLRLQRRPPGDRTLHPNLPRAGSGHGPLEDMP